MIFTFLIVVCLIQIASFPCYLLFNIVSPYRFFVQDVFILQVIFSDDFRFLVCIWQSNITASKFDLDIACLMFIIKSLDITFLMMSLSSWKFNWHLSWTGGCEGNDLILGIFQSIGFARPQCTQFLYIVKSYKEKDIIYFMFSNISFWCWSFCELTLQKNFGSSLRLRDKQRRKKKTKKEKERKKKIETIVRFTECR